MSSEPLAPELPEAVVADLCHLRIPSLPEWIDPTVDYLINRATLCGALHPNRAMKAMMALIEAVTNAIIHGNLGISSDLKEQGERAYAEAVAARCADPRHACRLVDIRAAYDGSEIRWVIADQGAGFDATAALRRLDESPPDMLRPSGRGLIMMRAFVDSLAYEDNGRRVILALRRQPNESRSSPRFPHQQPVQVTPYTGDGRADWQRTQHALSRNISHGGIGLLQSHLATNGRALVTIPNRGGEPIQIPAEVRHWHALSDNVVEVGCRFEAEGSSQADPPGPGIDVLRGLVERIAYEQKPLAERRISPRLPYTECLGIEMENGEQMRGFARDLSRTGIAFFTTRPLLPGSVRLTLPQGAGQEPIQVRASIVRCTYLTEGFHDVAARFLG